MQNWLYAWQRFAATPASPACAPAWTSCWPPGSRPTPRTCATHLTAERNHRTLELYALLLVGLAFDDDAARPGARWQDLADNAATDIWADGVHRECCTDYHLIVLRSLLGAIANARLFAPRQSRRRCVERARTGPATSRCTCSDRTG